MFSSHFFEARVLGTVAAFVVASIWSSCSHPPPPGGGFSVCKTALKIWLRILSIGLKEELKVLDYA